MATTQNQRKKKKESEISLQTLLADITTENLSEDEPLVRYKDGRVLYASDFKDLKDDGWDETPEFEAWMEEERERFKKYFDKHLPGWNWKDLDEFSAYKAKLEERQKDLSRDKIHKMALNVFRAKIKKRKEH